jgi:penicillin-binding protein 1A
MKNILKQIIILLFSIFIGSLIFIFTLPYTINNLVADDLTFTKKSLKGVTNIYSKEKEIIATIVPSESFIPIEDKLDSKKEKILLFFEDNRFYKHNGIDYRSIIRALYTNIKYRNIKEGGSTITQQIVKNEFLSNKKSFKRKFTEAFYSIYLEKKYSKEEILSQYLNTVYLGDNLYGFETASYHWFGKKTNELSLDEFILIANTIPSPNNFSPYYNKQLSYDRYKKSLDNLKNSNVITELEYNKIKKINPIDKIIPKSNQSKVIVKYPWLYSSINAELKRVYPNINFQDGNIDIFTNINLELQDKLESTIINELKKENSPNASGVIVDSNNKSVVAIVGGKDFSKSQVNTALGILGGGSGRQAGSLFKFLTLIVALEEGYKLTDTINAPKYVKIPGRKPVYNYDMKNYGNITLLNAFTNSVNTAFVNLAKELGTSKIEEKARKIGLDIKKRGEDITLGIDEVSPIQMATMFSTVSNNGEYFEPRIISRIVKNNVEIKLPLIRENISYSPKIIYDLKIALRSVVEKGTGKNAKIGNLPIIGKTGTTDNYTNAWFVGQYDKLTASIWVGFIEGQITMSNINNFKNITGGTIPAIIFRKTLEDYLKNKYKKQYDIPLYIPFEKEYHDYENNSNDIINEDFPEISNNDSKEENNSEVSIDSENANTEIIEENIINDSLTN